MSGGSKGIPFISVWFLACVVFLVLTPCAIAQNDEPLDPTPTEGPENSAYSLSGTVVNALTGGPVRRALVQIGDQSGGAAVTDDAGHFQIAGLKEGQAFVSVTKPGFGDWRAPEQSVVQVGKDAPAVVLKIVPAAMIFGRVTASDEQPLEGCNVHLVAKQYVDGRTMWADLPNQGRTNEEGEYRITGLSAGTYYVAVDCGQEMKLSQRGTVNAREEVFVKAFYPGVAEMSAASPLELSPGREMEANFELSPEPLYHVSGTASAEGETVVSMSFLRQAGSDQDFMQTVGVIDGRFEVKVPDGTYEVVATGQNGVQLSTPVASVTVNADNPDLHIALTRGLSIPVDILFENGAPGAEQTVRAQGGAPGIVVSLIPASSLQKGVNWWREPDGIQNVEPGTYSLQIQNMSRLWVKSAKSGSTDLLSDDLTVAEGGQAAPIEITLRKDGGNVNGTVSPASNSWPPTVLLVQPRGKKNYVKAVRAEGGSFDMQGVPPGEYAVVAIDHGDQLEYMNPEVLNPYLLDAQHVSVRPNGNTTVNLSLIAKGR